jgi:hypothetical protein
VGEDGGQERSGQQPSCSVPRSPDVRTVTASSRSIWVIHLVKAPVELARLTGIPALGLKTVHALIDLLTRPWRAEGAAPEPHSLGLGGSWAKGWPSP